VRLQADKVSLIYRMKPKSKKWKKNTLKMKMDMMRSIGK